MKRTVSAIATILTLVGFGIFARTGAILDNVPVLLAGEGDRGSADTEGVIVEEDGSIQLV